MSDLSTAGGLSFRIAAAIICITCIFYSAVMRSFNRKRLRGRLFMLLLVITLIDSTTGIISDLVLASHASHGVKYLIVYLCEYVYYCTHMMVAPIFWLYITVVCDMLYRFSRKALALRFLPFVILEILALSNPLTGFVFLIGDNLSVHRGKGVYIAYAISGLYLFYCVYLLARYWRTMSILQKVAMFYFLGLAITGTFVQMVFTQFKSELICESLGLMGIMIMIERDEYRLDYKTRSNNRGALVIDMRSLLETGRHFYVICVRVINSELYRRVIGYSNFDMVTGQIADFLLDLDKNYDVYRTTGGQFFIICKDVDEAQIDRALHRIGEQLSMSFDTSAGPTDIKARVLCARCPEEFSSINDILLLQDANIDDTEKMVLKGEDIGFLFRRIDVENAIVRSINNDTFKVLYQPVYDKETLRIKSAEALLTLKDEQLGAVSFAEFMSVAEDTGFGEELEYRMIEAVFRFIKAGVMKSDMNMSAMVIHIMSVKVINLNLVEKVKSYLDEHKVDPHIVIFDVVDTMAVQAPEELALVIDEFSQLGIRFMLISSDAGFMGLSHTMIDKLDGIVINVNAIRDNGDKEQKDIILRNRIAMIRQLGKAVILSGIDDKQSYDMIGDRQVNSILGDYLGKPVTKNELQIKFWHGEVFYEKG